MIRRALRSTGAACLAAVVLAAIVGGCGRYGPPRRAEVRASPDQAGPVEDARSDDERDEETSR